MEAFSITAKKVNYEELTNNEKKLLVYLNENTKEVVKTNMRIEKMAEVSHTGYSAIYGLLKKFKISGYKELIISLRLELDYQEKNNNLEKELKVKHQYLKFLEQNYEANVLNLKKTTDLIKKAPRLCVIYWDYGLIGVARQMWRTLHPINQNTYISDKEEVNIKYLKENIKLGDVFVIYTNHTYKSKRFFSLFESIVKNNGKIIYIGNRNPEKELSSMIESEHVVVPIESDNGKEYSQYGLFAFINDLIIARL